MFKRICLLIMALVFIGCAHSQRNTIGGLHKSLETGMSVYHQYLITTVHVDKKKTTFHHNSVFLADYNKFLPSNIKNLKLSMTVINPFKVDFEVWERVNHIDLETEKLIFKSEKLRYPLDNHQLLPEELFSFDLPIYAIQPTQILFSVVVKDRDGKVVYSTYTARYKIGSKNK